MTLSRGLWRDLPRFNATGQLESTGPEARYPTPAAFTPRGRAGGSVAPVGEGGQLHAPSGDDRNSLVAATALDEMEHAGQRLSDRIDIGSLTEFARHRARSVDRGRPEEGQTSGAHSSSGAMTPADSGRVREANELAATSELCFPAAATADFVKLSGAWSEAADAAALQPGSAAALHSGCAAALQPTLQPATAEASSAARAAAAQPPAMELGELELLLAASEQRLGGWMALDDYVPGLAKVLGGAVISSPLARDESIYTGKFDDEDLDESWKPASRSPPVPPPALLLSEPRSSASVSRQLRGSQRSCVKVSQ